MSNVKKEITIDAVIEEVPKIMVLLEETLEEVGASIKAMSQLSVAVDEIVSNVCYYAYKDTRGTVTVKLEYDDSLKQIKLACIDSGTQYNPLELEDPDITLSASERKIGGLGIFIVKKTMDDVSYEYKDGQNILTLYKNI